MTDPIRASDRPMIVEVERGKSYRWCACGKSDKQPFCDGSHKGSGWAPITYEATETKKVSFCCCKSSANAPFCDGSHSK